MNPLVVDSGEHSQLQAKMVHQVTAAVAAVAVAVAVAAVAVAVAVAAGGTLMRPLLLRHRKVATGQILPGTNSTVRPRL